MTRKRKVKKLPILFTFLIFIFIIFGCLYIFNDKFIKTNTENPTELNKEDENTLVYSGTITVAGNILVNSNMWYDTINSEGTYDFDYVLGDLKDTIKKSNINIYSQQSIVGGEELGESSYYNYNSPVEEVDAMLDMGFNMVALASYQSYDKGLEGITNTLNYYNENSVIYSGISDTEENRLKNNVITKNGITYGLLSYTMDTDEEFEDSYLVNIYSNDQAKSDIDAIKNSVDIIIVSIDWSEITSEEVTDEQKEIATYLSELGANIIIGNTNYVIQPIELKDNTIIFYSLGNLLTGHSSVDSRISMIVDFQIKITKTDEETKLEFNNINALLTYNYNQYKTNYKVIPFTKITNELTDYETYYEKYSEIIKENNESITLYELGD